jgi:iron complex outermembrane recepter protein
MQYVAGSSGTISSFARPDPRRAGRLDSVGRLFWNGLRAIGLVVVGFTTTRALAQVTPAAGDTGADTQLEEVVVTAGKRGDVALQKTPYNISAIGQQLIEQTGSVSLEDVSKLVPGLEVVGSNGDQKIIIRGLAASAGEPQVATYLDETPLPGSDELTVQQPDVLLFDMQRVEVLRGPQGTLYGADSEGGAIRYVTNKPDLERFSGSVDGIVGRRDWGGGADSSGNVVVNVPIVTDVFGVRAMGYIQHVDGLQDRPDLGFTHTDVQNRYGGRLEAELNISSSTRIVATGVYQDNNTADRSYVLPGTTDTPGKVLTPFWDKLSLVNLTLDQQLGWGVLTATGSYTDRSTSNINDASQTPFFPGQTYFLNNLGHTLVNFGELRFGSNFSGPFQTVAGLYLQDRTVNTDTVGLFASSVTGKIDSSTTFYRYYEDFTFRSRAAFVNGTYKLTDKLSLEGGIRVYDEAQEQNNLLVQSPFSTPGPTRLGSKATGHVARGQASYQVTDDALVYGLYSEGFRPGGPNNKILDAAFPAQYQPDEVKNYELGVKTQWFDRALTLNGSIYYMTWNDIQVMEANSAGVSYTANAGTAALKGLEIEGSARPVPLPGLAINFSLRVSEQKLTENSPTFDPVLAPYAGKDGDAIPQSSKSGASVGAEQQFKVFALQAFVRADAAYTGKAATTFTPGDPDYKTYGGYVLGNLKLGVAEPTWTAAIFARNIGNKRTNSTGWFENLVGIYDRIYQPPPFEIGVEAGYKF